ncbi:MAG: hypothetical protein ACJA0T_001720 [Colwellia sp.]|jgi:hypothetical protein
MVVYQLSSLPSIALNMIDVGNKPAIQITERLPLGLIQTKA